MTRQPLSPLFTLGGPWAVAAAIGGAVYAGALPPVCGAGVLALVMLGPLWTFRDHAPSILVVFLVVLLGGVLAGNPLPRWRSNAVDPAGATELLERWSRSGGFDRGLPIVLHLVFDELMSPGAIPDAYPGAAALHREVLALRRQHALRLFDSVYSRHFFSGESLPNMMAAEYRGETTLVGLDEALVSGGRDNEAFADVQRRGYRTVVFQTSHVNFCGSAAVDMCETFASFDPPPDGAGGDGAPGRTAALWSTMARSFAPSFTSRLGRSLLDRIAGWRSPRADALGVADRYDVQGFPAWFDRFAAFTAGVPRGTHVFAHFMAPHTPYLLTEECAIGGSSTVGYYLGSRYPPEARGTAQRDFYRDYIAQARCIVRKLDELLSRIEQAPAYRDALVIVHGDHGSRISNGNVLEDMNQRDFIDNYATFFAVRSPAAVPGVDCGFRSLGQAFRQAMAPPDGRLEPAAAPPVSVISRAAGGAKAAAPMPIFGCAADAR